MDERERDYLRQQIHDLERSKRRWRLATFSLAAALAIVLVVGAMSSFPMMQMVRTRERAMLEMERARYAEEEARRQAEQAAQQLQQRERQAKQSEAGPRN